MMASFMHYCRRARLFSFILHIALSGILFSFSLAASADGSSLQIKSAELVPADGAYVLNADFEINFSSEIEDALNKGVPLSFLVEFQITSLQRYWFDDEIVSASTRINISYHALSRQYLLMRGSHQQSFSNLRDAEEELSYLHGWKVVDKSLLKKGEVYNAALRIRLDQSALPKPLQVEALSSGDWTMVSERYRWTPAFAL